jgi:hypothetical protein
MIPALRPDQNERKQSCAPLKTFVSRWAVGNYDIEAVRATGSKGRPHGARIESIKGTNK